jgi:hypothetical protein
VGQDAGRRDQRLATHYHSAIEQGAGGVEDSGQQLGGDAGVDGLTRAGDIQQAGSALQDDEGTDAFFGEGADGIYDLVDYPLSLIHRHSFQDIAQPTSAPQAFQSHAQFGLEDDNQSDGPRQDEARQ